jgi:hypothetical protein
MALFNLFCRVYYYYELFKINVYKIMALPHLKNSQAGVNRFDPVHNSIFEVYFTLPEALRAEFCKDELLLTEHVTKVDGLGALYRSPGTESQKFMGTERSYVKPQLDNTRAEITIDFTLNLRNGTDDYIRKLFRAWAALNYDVQTGKRVLKKDYCADWLKISIANRAGDIHQEIIFKDVMINGDLSTSTDLDYTNGTALELSVPFVSDWWDEKIA